MILKIDLIAFYRTTWKEKREKEGSLIRNCGSICVRCSQAGVCGGKQWVAWRAVKEEDTSRLINRK